MRKVKVKLGSRSYDIIIGKLILKKLGVYLRKLNIGSDAYIITNALLKNRYGVILSKVLLKANFSCRFKTVSDSERSKSLESAGCVIKDLAKFDQKRRVFIIAFGGGVVGDLAGFVASVYKRGVGYIQIPTTLLAQVDSAIGGKTAVDLDLGKNLIGAFYQPRLVFSEIDFLKTLDKRQVASGMAEVIKYAIIKDNNLFCYLENRHKDVFESCPTVLEKIISSCSKIKASIASRDEKERLGLRTILNFGHTIGHAIESACGYKGYNHGEAVGLGMIAASVLSCKLGLIDNKLALRIENLIKLYGLPIRLKGVSINKIIDAYYHDKKFVGKQNKLVLIRGIAKPMLVRNVALDLIKEAVRKIA
ncbi:MAG: 3-dehydroquinate synthase [Candidatus Omnitrophica bacterium]|nr:3-dehydroquinate synthase [Candidatus Omnitrophota bacterium]MBU1923438.1 3-dehydroquinate synthase [Candidatus Omnitrophota bacterium]